MRGKPWLGVPLGVVAGAVLAFAGGVRANWTPSLPMGLYVVRSVHGVPARGQLVRACLPDGPAALARERDYLGRGPCPRDTMPVLKPVAAVPGDVVIVDADGVRVNGERVAVPALARDSRGRLMQAVPPGTYAVAPGAVWLLSDHNGASFDARYFGPVPVASIDAIARPLLVF